MRKSRYERFLNDLLNDVFDLAERFGWSQSELARRSGISLTTVLRYQYRLTPFPRLKSCLGLCWAVGLDVAYYETGVKVARSKKAG